MKSALVLCLLGLVALSMAAPEGHSRGCLYIMGQCKSECPEGTHAYTSACRQKLPEATCEQPNPVHEGGNLCDFSACYCDDSTVRNTQTNQCVPLDQCPKKE